jgi:hypothetical protein
MLIGLNAIVCEAGPVASAEDWWAMAAAIAEGAVLANIAWLRRRELDELELERLRLRYSPRPALHVGDNLAQGLRLAPALVHERVGSCIDLACYCAALLRLRGRADARVQFRIDRIQERGHAVVVGSDFEFDPTMRLLDAGQPTKES